MDSIGAFLPLILLVLAFYYLIIRPQRVRQQQMFRLQEALRPGLEVRTSSGLYGTVSSVEDDVVVLEVAPGVTNRYAKGAITHIVPEPEPENTTPGDERDADTARGNEVDRNEEK